MPILKLLLKLFLFPFAIMYDLITRWRNRLYDVGQKKSISFDVLVVNIGNLTVGGTGKTPHVAMLTEIYSNIFGRKVAILSRGYGRSTKGFLLADQNSSSHDIGDEPLQLYRALASKIPVAVCEERIVGIPFLLQEFPETDTILLDDAFQHRKVKPNINILLCDYNRPFYKDFLLPAGRLREARQGAKRADMVIVSKTPEHISEEEAHNIKSEIGAYSSAPVFFSKYQYQPPQIFSGDAVQTIKKVILVTGIANSKYLLSYVMSQYTLLKHFEFADHINYSEKHIAQIRTYFDSVNQEDTVVLTTEKDMVKLNELLVGDQKVPYYFLPIQCKILNQEKEFLDCLKKIRLI